MPSLSLSFVVSLRVFAMEDDNCEQRPLFNNRFKTEGIKRYFFPDRKLCHIFCQLLYHSSSLYEKSTWISVWKISSKFWIDFIIVRLYAFAVVKEKPRAIFWPKQPFGYTLTVNQGWKCFVQFNRWQGNNKRNCKPSAELNPRYYRLKDLVNALHPQKFCMMMMNLKRRRKETGNNIFTFYPVVILGFRRERNSLRIQLQTLWNCSCLFCQVYMTLV